MAGPSSVIDAIAHGKRAAAAIDNFLAGRVLAEGIRTPAERPNPLTKEEIKQLRKKKGRSARISMPELASTQRTSDFGEVEQPYTSDQAQTEARRCLNCAGCSECMLCVQACQAGAIDHEPHDEDSQARLVKVDGRHAPHHNLKLPGGAKLPPHALPGAGPAEGAHPHDGAHGRPRPAVPPPLRDAEPDLATVEGCCAVLEIPASASMDAIVKAFRAKAKLYHPDKVRHLSERMQELAAEEFRRLRRAYEALTRRTARPLTGVNWPEGMARYTSPYDYSPAEYEVLAGINPANTNILYNLAWKYFEDGRYNDARAWFERVLAIDRHPRPAQPPHRLGQCRTRGREMELGDARWPDALSGRPAH